MTIHRNDYGNLRSMPPSSGRAGTVLAAIYEFTLSEDYTAATDFIEFGILPAGCRPIRATLIGAGFTAGTTADVGFLTGKPGADTEADGTDRTLSADLFNDADVVDNEADQTADNLLSVAASTENRSIGAELSVDEAAGSKTIKLLLEYIN